MGFLCLAFLRSVFDSFPCINTCNMLRSLLVLRLISLFIRMNIYGRYTECLDHQCCILQLSIVVAWMISKSRCGALIPIVYSDASLMERQKSILSDFSPVV